MSIRKRIAGNTLTMLAANGVRVSASLVLVLMTGRLLGAEGLGHFSVALSVYFISQTVSSLGLQSMISRDLSQREGAAPRIFSSALTLNLTAGAVLMLVMLLAAQAGDFAAPSRRAMMILSPGLLAFAFNLNCQSVYIAAQRTGFVAAGLAVENAIKLGLGFWVLRAGHGVPGLALAVLAGAWGAALFNGVALSLSFFRPGIRSSWTLCLDLLRQTPTFAGIALFNTLFWNTSVILLSQIRPMEEVGIYAAALRIFGVFKLAAQSYKWALHPVICRMFSDRPGALVRLRGRMVALTLALVMPVALGVALAGGWLLPLAFGEQFSASVISLRWLAGALVPYSVSAVLACFLIAGHNQRVDLRINGTTALLHLALSALFINQWGAAGTAGAVTVSCTIFLAQQVRHFSRETQLDVALSAATVTASHTN